MQITTPNEPSSENEQPTAIIDNDLFIEHIIQSAPMQSILSRPHSHAEKGGQGVIKSHLPKYIFSLPQSAPQRTQKRETVSGHLGNSDYGVSHVVDTCLQVPSIPPNSAAPTYLPALTSSTLSK